VNTATCRPGACPAWWSRRACWPAKTRLSPATSAAARRLAKLGVTPMTTVNAAVPDAERAHVLLRIGVLSVPLRGIGESAA
jgi:hypothetical protein